MSKQVNKYSLEEALTGNIVVLDSDLKTPVNDEIQIRVQTFLENKDNLLGLFGIITKNNNY
jgi:hypothetical protein